MIDHEDRAAAPSPASSDDSCDVCAVARAGQQRDWNWIWSAKLRRALCFCPGCSRHHLSPVPAAKPWVRLEDVVGAPKKGEA